MRTNEERVAAVQRLVIEIKKQKKMRFNRLVTVSSIAACFILIVSLSVYMPRIVNEIGTRHSKYFETAASMFSRSNSLGYVVIALIAFILGICVTLLAYHLHYNKKWNQKSDGEDQND